MMTKPTNAANPCGLLGIEFVEFASPDADRLDELWRAFGFSRLAQHQDQPLDLYVQGDIRFLVNRAPDSFGGRFTAAHGPAACAMGWRFADAQHAFAQAVRRGARPYDGARGALSFDVPAIYGIGDSLIYFFGPEDSHGKHFERTFVPHPEAMLVPDHGPIGTWTAEDVGP